ncbi:putative elongator complex protein 1 [Aspergillus melleus]|uniref:putative elongator complex protein 1 n=1 Tax=Aspergillus melleus TaxID=138277 RepID=UPI001E8EB0D5|nr:putative elongator complex protein 1 [Aspergillus melleus]KAH8428745.1 putative elongator complex protein 1 [Aspergillus melleus]
MEILLVLILTDESEQAPEQADDAIEHMCFLTDANRLYDHALGLYDLELTLLVAQQAQRASSTLEPSQLAMLTVFRIPENTFHSCGSFSRPPKPDVFSKLTITWPGIARLSNIFIRSTLTTSFGHTQSSTSFTRTPSTSTSTSLSNYTTSPTPMPTTFTTNRSTRKQASVGFPLH